MTRFDLAPNLACMNEEQIYNTLKDFVAPADLSVRFADEGLMLRVHFGNTVQVLRVDAYDIYKTKPAMLYFYITTKLTSIKAKILTLSTF